MQEVDQNKRKILDTILLLRKVYGYRMEPEVLNEAEYRIQIDGVVVLTTSEYQDLKALLLEALEIKGLETKKEIYDRLSKLSSLYLNFLNDKGKREVLKDIIPSVDKLISAFFDISKYCANEHIFDGFTIKNMTYEKLLLLFPNILERLKEQKKEEKKKELRNYFDECKTLPEAYRKIDELITNKQSYLAALKEVYLDYENFFSFYEFSKNEIDVNSALNRYTYETLYQLFLMKTIDMKKQELDRDNEEYNLLLKDYQDSMKKKIVLEVEPYFDTIQKTDQNLKKDQNNIELQEQEKRNQLEIKNQEYLEIETKKLALLEKNFLIRLSSGKKIKELEEKLEQLEKLKIEDKKFIHELSLKKEDILNEISNNEKHLQKLCNFTITIDEYASLLNQTLGETTLEQLNTKVKELEKSLMKYHIEKKEEELISICKKHNIALEDIDCNKM